MIKQASIVLILFLSLFSNIGNVFSAPTGKDRVNAFQCFTFDEIAYLLITMKINGIVKAKVMNAIYARYPQVWRSKISDTANLIYADKQIRTGMTEKVMNIKLNMLFSNCIVENKLVAYQEKIIHCRYLGILAFKIFALKEKGVSVTTARNAFRKFLTQERVGTAIVDAIYSTDDTKEDYKRQIWIGCASDLTAKQ